MAFVDPQSVTIDGTAVSLVRTGLTLDQGDFRAANGNTELAIAHTRGRRNRHLVKLSVSSIVSDPLVPANMIPVSYSAHLVIDGPLQGVTNDQLQKLATGLVAWATPANLSKLVASES